MSKKKNKKQRGKQDRAAGNEKDIAGTPCEKVAAQKVADISGPNVCEKDTGNTEASTRGTAPPQVPSVSCTDVNSQHDLCALKASDKPGLADADVSLNSSDKSILYVLELENKMRKSDSLGSLPKSQRADGAGDKTIRTKDGSDGDADAFIGDVAVGSKSEMRPTKTPTPSQVIANDKHYLSSVTTDGENEEKDTAAEGDLRVIVKKWFRRRCCW